MLPPSLLVFWRHWLLPWKRTLFWDVDLVWNHRPFSPSYCSHRSHLLLVIVFPAVGESDGSWVLMQGWWCCCLPSPRGSRLLGVIVSMSWKKSLLVDVLQWVVWSPVCYLPPLVMLELPFPSRTAASHCSTGSSCPPTWALRPRRCG